MSYVRTSGKKRHEFVPYNGKIADITEADTNTHTLTLANGAGSGAISTETRMIVSVRLKPSRVSGTGNFLCYPNEGVYTYTFSTTEEGEVGVAAGSQRLQYALSVVNDDWDLYCFGYVVEA